MPSFTENKDLVFKTEPSYRHKKTPFKRNGVFIDDLLGKDIGGSKNALPDHAVLLNAKLSVRQDRMRILFILKGTFSPNDRTASKDGYIDRWRA